MNIGIIAEYNPFHNGHKHHIEAAKKNYNARHIVVIMSGNFVQRGEPAILNKFERAKAALLNGADIVLELPAVYSTSAADIFAFGAVDILNKTNIIDGLCFGCETENIDILKKISDILCNETEELKKFLFQELSNGYSYPKARMNAVSKILDKDLSYLNQPNNILALEYIKSLKLTNSIIQPLTILRQYADYNSININSEIASAAAIRNALYNKDIKSVLKATPQNTHSILNFNKLPSINDYSLILNYILRIQPLSQISNIADITEGLENRIIKFANLNTITEMIDKIKTKRYTYTKIQRALLHIILNIKKSDIDLKKSNPYIRVLGFKKESSELLSLLTKNSAVPVIINIKNAEKQLNDEAMSFLKREIIYTDIYNQFTNKIISEDYTHPISII